jgi:hypothetical protein
MVCPGAKPPGDFLAIPMNNTKELSVIQKTHDLIRWYIPILNRLPKDFKYTSGTRTSNHLYLILEE